MTKKLFLQAVSKFVLGVAVTGVLIFGTAGTIRFWNGWLLMGILFIPLLFTGILLMVKNPQLLKMRLKAKETQREQNTVVKLSGLMFLAGFAAAGIQYRFQWRLLPKSVSAGAAIIFLLAYLLYAEVLRENTYLSRTVEVQAHQKVIDTGLYSIVRHPMYSATLLMFLSMPLVLGSLCSFFIFLAYPLMIVRRIKYEEALLESQLEGYCAYQKKVKYRLIPFMW